MVQKLWPRKLWQQLKELGYKNKGNEGTKIILKINDEICHDSRTIADHFNEFFTTVATNLVSKLPKAIYKFSVDSHLFKEFYSSRNTTNSHMTLKPVSEDFIYKELLKLNPTKSTGLDEIPARFIRDGACILKVPICFIVNQSIFSGIVPDDMKVARVKPLYKKNSPLEVGNYRPVSILSIVSKILERSVYSQLSKFLDSNNLLFEYQSGFRSKFSTDTCLIHLLDYIKGNSAKGLFTGMIMLDLQKAFDTVDHDILCDKLKVMGVESVNWFRSYLSDRKQFVCINEVSSKSGHVSCGVPQGSILGPLLFLIYVNDMSMSIDNDCKLILYADDSAILFPHKNPDVISNKLGKVLESCSSWLVDNKLSLHLGKTECMLFGPRKKLRKITKFQVVCNGHVIKATDKVKYLGLSIDSLLNGESIVSSIIQKVNARLKFLYRQAGCLDRGSRMTLSSALIQCYFDYSCSSWFSSLSKHLKQKLQVCQNKMVRFILNLGPRHSINCDILDSLNMLNVEARVKQLRLNHVFNIVQGLAPNYLQENFTLVSSTSRYATRSSSNRNFIVPQISTYEAGTFYYSAIKDWNVLPVNIKEITNKDTFKDALKQFLKQQSRECEEDSFVYF